MRFKEMFVAVLKSEFSPKTRRAIRMLDHAREHVHRGTTQLQWNPRYGNMSLDEHWGRQDATQLLLDKWQRLYAPWLT